MKRLVCLALATLAWLSPFAFAQKYPDRPIRVVIPYAPGGGTDNLMRIIAPVVSESLGQQLVIDNKPGGGSIIGTEIVVRAAPDGYTVLATDSAVLVNPGLFKKKLTFDTEKALTGVTMMASAPVLLAAHPSVPAKDLRELVALAKSKPGFLNYGSGGPGSSTHLAGELFKLRAGVDITHIPYKGSGPAMTDLVAGQIHLNFTGPSSSAEFLKAGRLRALAVTGKERLPAMPDIPTFEEGGVSGVDADSYWGIYAPAGTPPEVLNTLSEHFARALRNPAVVERIRGLGYRVIANSPQEHTRMMREAIARWTEVIEKAKITVE